MASATASRQVLKNGIMMREKFDFSKYPISNWFPGHMGRGVTQVNQRIRDIDCAIEVHDARIPFSGRNPLFEKQISQVKPHLLVLNKVDLINKRESDTIREDYGKLNQKFLFTNCKKESCGGMNELVPIVIDLIKKSDRYHRALNKDYCIMIMGIPNVGKSSIINALRVKYMHKGKATSVGALPGITKSVLEKIKICEDPLIYVRDTPGILEPRIRSVETGLKLALVNTIKEHLVGEEIIADYLLFRMNSLGNHKYVKFLELDEPSDDIRRVLGYSAVKKNLILKRRNISEGGYSNIPNVKSTAQLFLTAYRNGLFGSLNLDLT